MKYYKIIKDNNFIGVVCSTDFIRYQKKNQYYASADETNGEFVDYNGLLYRSTWMAPVPNESTAPYETAIIIEISEEEYNQLYEAIENNEEIPVEEPEYISPVIDNTDPVDEATVEFIRSSKLAEMSYACRTAIEDGIDLEIGGQPRHFSLTTQDQLNLISLSAMAQTQNVVPYHADGEESTFFTADEINQIITAMNELKIYHTNYYNSLKSYINSLETIEEISAITYGTQIPDEYQSEVLKVLGQ